MEKEVKKMSMRLSFVGEGRLCFSLDSKLLAALIRRAYSKLYAGSRYVFTIAHDLLHWLLPELWHWLNDKSSIWFDPCAAEKAKKENRVRAIVFSEELLVRYLHLVEWIRASVDVLRKAVLRHQDRGSGDAVSHNDNLKKECLNVPAVAAVRATYINRLSLLQEVFDNAGRRNSGSLRRDDGTLLQRTGVRLLPANR